MSTVIYSLEMRDITPMKNTGKPSEQQFENCLNTLYGKQVAIFRVEDSLDLYALNNAVVNSSKKPCDYFVCVKGVSMMAEVKSSISKTSFAFKCIAPHQLGAAKRMRMAGGVYLFFVHRLETDTFYVLTLKEIEEAEGQSLKWSQMQEWTEYQEYKTLGNSQQP